MNVISKSALIAALIFAAMLTRASAEPYDGAGPGESTIGVGGDYASLYNACEAMSAAPLTAGDWDFLILNDLEEPLNSTITQSESSSHTITLRPAPGVNATVTFTTTQSQSIIRTVGHLTIGAKTVYETSGTTLTYVQTHDITIDGCNTPGGATRNLTFKNVAGDGARTLIGVMGHCDNITVKNCRLDSYGVYARSGYTEPIGGVDFAHRSLGEGTHAPPAEVQHGGSVGNCEIRSFTGNVAVGVSLNFPELWYRFSNQSSDKFTVTDCDITSFTVGIRVAGVSDFTAEHNVIRSGQGEGSSYGIYAEPLVENSRMKISRNTIYFQDGYETSSLAGIHTRELRSDCETVIDNNVIAGRFNEDHDYSGIPFAYGVMSETNAGSTVTLRCNSISLNGVIYRGRAAGFYLGGYPNHGLHSYGKAILRNNIIRTEVPGSIAVQTEGRATTLDSDYNNLFATSGAYIGRCAYPLVGQPNLRSLAWWQNASGQDTHSSNLDPYVATGVGLGTWIGPMGSDQEDLHFTAYPGPDYLAPALAQVITDIDRDARPGDWVVMGADEMPHPPAGVAEWELY